MIDTLPNGLATSHKMKTTAAPKFIRVKARHVKLLLLAAAMFFTIASCIDAPQYAYEGGAIYLQHLGTLVLLVLLMLDVGYQKMAMAAYVCLFLFACIHILGARYLYSNVPYDQWANSFLNIKIDIAGDWTIKAEGTGVMHGNKFNRLVHLSFGLLLFPVVLQMVKHKLGSGNLLLSILLSWLVIQTFSMLYEIFEWMLSIALSPEHAESYNGQQGDMWDAQKDMALALLGSSISAIWAFFSHRQMTMVSNTESLRGPEG